jgi:hypothetical protein
MEQPLHQVAKSLTCPRAPFFVAGAGSGMAGEWSFIFVLFYGIKSTRLSQKTTFIILKDGPCQY